jgi:hypothetical protein
VEGAAAVPTPFSFFPRPWTSNRYAGRQGIKMSSDTKREGSKMLGGRARRVEYFTTLDRVSICECTGRPNNWIVSSPMPIHDSVLNICLIPALNTCFQTQPKTYNKAETTI